MLHRKQIGMFNRLVMPRHIDAFVILHASNYQFTDDVFVKEVLIDLREG